MNIKNIIKIVVTGGALAAALTGCCLLDCGKDSCCIGGAANVGQHGVSGSAGGSMN